MASTMHVVKVQWTRQPSLGMCRACGEMSLCTLTGIMPNVTTFNTCTFVQLL